MTVFQISTESGNTRILNSRIFGQTPVLFEINKGLMHNKVPVDQYVLSQDSLIKLNYNINDHNKLDEISYDQKLVNISFFTPKLIPPKYLLKKSYEYELDLYLDRLDQVSLPKVFGLPFDPINSGEEHLNELLEYKPSIIALRLNFIEKMNPKLLIEIITKSRDLLPPNIAIYLPGGAPIGFQSLCIGLGIDILDTSSAYRVAGYNQSFQDGFIYRDYRSKSFKDLVKINLEELRRDFKGIKFAISNNILWTRIARDMHVHPNVANSVRSLSSRVNEYIQLSKFPRLANNQLNFTGEEALFHPEIVKYRQRLLSRYDLPDDIKIVILLPCSAKKPYRESKSHRIYENAITRVARKHRDQILIWSLTSPLGVVPYELEKIYPAKHYDISVTGQWSGEEEQVVINMLSNMIEATSDDTIFIAHISLDYKNIIDQVKLKFKDRIIISWEDKFPTSKEATKKLSTIIRENIKLKGLIINNNIKERRKFQEVNSIIYYNHKVKSPIDYDDIQFNGYPPRPIQIKYKNDHWLTWDTLNGNVRTSILAANQLYRQSVNWIKTNIDLLTGSSLFAPGVIKASEAISPGDEVIILNEDESRIIAIGEAIISGISMNKIDYGPVVKIKQRLKMELTS